MMHAEDGGSRTLERSFFKFRNRTFDQKADDALKRRGQKILDKYAPEKTSVINTHSVFWMMASIAVFYYTDFHLTLMYDKNITWFYLYPGFFLLGVSTSIGTMLICYYHYYLGISDYETKHPYAVPIATVAFIGGMILLCIGLWPAWSIFTPFILFALFMGFVFFMSALPI